MLFVNRLEEMHRLDRIAARSTGGFAVLYGRRRVGKTRLLVEWAAKHEGLYTVADQSTAEIQRGYFAASIAQHLTGFADVEYPDWRSLFSRLAQEAKTQGWRGPIIIDELPYLVLSSPELPSVLQRWLDHQAKEARLIVAVAGSSQRMMQGLVLSASAPLYGRAQEIIPLAPLDAAWLPNVFPKYSSKSIIEAFAAWGGIPRYWELASEEHGSLKKRLDRLVLDPLGPLHREPDRILLEEIPSAVELRPILDAIGFGAHRPTEIAGRIGHKVTSMSKPLSRLLEMNLIAREIPFGENEKKSKRSLYKIADPLFRLWFRVVAPHRALLATAQASDRIALLDRFWPRLVAEAWEDLCRQRLPMLHAKLGSGSWGPASRWWRGNQPEWDVVSATQKGEQLLLGEAKWIVGRISRARIEREIGLILKRVAPDLPKPFDDAETIRVLFVPKRAPNMPKRVSGVHIVDAAMLLDRKS